MYKIFINFFLIVFTGCSSVALKVEPTVEEQLSDKTPKISSKIVYDGNINYLPTLFIHDINSNNIIYYEYNVKYINGSTKYDALNLWNPLVVAGFPLSEEAVIVESRLKFFIKDKKEKIFTATCIANKTRSLFQNAGSTEARQKCLLAVRDNIDNQIIKFIQGGLDADK